MSAEILGPATELGIFGILIYVVFKGFTGINERLDTMLREFGRLAGK